MSKLSPDIKRAINICLSRGLAFAVYCEQGEVKCVFDADAGSCCPDQHFTITRWLEKIADSTAIYSNLTVDDVLDIGMPDMACMKTYQESALPLSTPKDLYIEKLGRLIERLRQRGGKTVISRVITGKKPGIDWAEVADRVFDRFPQCMCHIFYHPSVGAWLGATPEVVLEAENAGHYYSTMSLAGTKNHADIWDEKNRLEQQMVTDFIVDKLTPLSKFVRVEPVKDLNYGNIDHLCTIIKGEMKDNITQARIHDVLSPTPAVAGYPRDIAVDEIKSIEQHARRCYGGTICTRREDTSTAYVNLRCLQFIGDEYSIYVGGGITALSDPGKEWRETEAKADALVSIINSF